MRRPAPPLAARALQKESVHSGLGLGLLPPAHPWSGTSMILVGGATVGGSQQPPTFQSYTLLGRVPGCWQAHLSCRPQGS